jgi:hypothetical protein
MASVGVAAVVANKKVMETAGYAAVVGVAELLVVRTTARLDAVKAASAADPRRPASEATLTQSPCRLKHQRDHGAGDTNEGGDVDQENMAQRQPSARRGGGEFERFLRLCMRFTE